MASSPQFASTPRVGQVVISTANTARDGTGTLGTVFTAGASGSRIDTIVVKALGNTTAGMVRLFIHDGTNARLYVEVPIGANTASASVKTEEKVLTSKVDNFMPIFLPQNYSLRASTHNAESFAITALGGDF